jgi:galactokinase
MSIDLKAARAEYEAHFGAPPVLVVRAPGRVNIIGEHTDYNHGFVLPMAIEQETVILATPRDDGVLNACAANLGRTGSSPLGRWERNSDESWLDYIVGVACELDKLGKPLTGADLMVRGDVPIGSGLSSSASLEMAALVLFETMGGFTVEGPEAPLLGQRVENGFIGVNSGIMDQFIIRMGQAGHALFLDCRSHAYDLIPVAFPNARFVIANTAVTRGLSASKYNERVAECAEAAEGMRAVLGKEGTHLRDFSLADLEAARESVAENAYRRARHVMTEDERTAAACDAMRAGDAARLGELMNASDHSLRDDYEVTCPELDTMTEIARALEGCYGARMTGAGFGGCTVNLVAADKADAFAEQLMAEYTGRTGLKGEAVISSPSQGAGVVEGSAGGQA